jgi:hypothetical protein
VRKPENGHRSLTAPALTYWPHPSSDIRAWLALVDHGAWERWGLYDSAIDREMPRYLRHASGLSLEEAPPALPPGVPEPLRAIFEAPDKNTLDELLGVQTYDENHRLIAWKPGLARLEPQESTAIRMSIERNFDQREIAVHMTPKARRFQDQMSLETVNQLLYRARRKLRELFGAGAPGGTSSLTPSLTPTQPSTATPDASAPATTTPKTSPRTRSFATSKTAISYASPSPC